MPNRRGLAVFDIENVATDASGTPLKIVVLTDPSGMGFARVPRPSDLPEILHAQALGPTSVSQALTVRLVEPQKDQ